MVTLEAPPDDAKAGLKIDYLAKRLGRVLAPVGFKRKGRALLREGGDDVQRHWCIVHLQAGENNDGPRGEFYVNLELQFPAIDRQLARRAGLAWLLERADQPDPARGHLQERLESLLHEKAPGHALAGLGIRLRADDGLGLLGEQLDAAIRDVGLPWLEAHTTLEAVRDFTGSLLVADIPTRVAAALALSDTAAAQRLVDAHSGRWENFRGQARAQLRDWFAASGVNVDAMPSQAPAPVPSAWEVRRAAKVDLAEQAQAAQAAQLAVVPPERREAALLELLARLVKAEAEATATRSPIRDDAQAFEVDDSVRDHLQTLLPLLKNASADTCTTVVDAMDALTPRLKRELVTATYPWGFKELACWLIDVGAAHRAVLAPRIDRWLTGFAVQIAERHRVTSAALEARRAEPLDPANPMYDTLRALRERQAEIAKQAPPVGLEEVLQRLRELPEQALLADDRRAILLWRRWLRRDPQTGALPPKLDDDDWGNAWNAAWRAAPPALQAAATATVQTWLEGVDSRPSARWLRSLRAQIDGFDASQACAWRAWLLQRLADFTLCSGRIQWATTGARPGWGARLGESSEAVLLGALWWSAFDPAVGEAARATAWRAVADAAWLRLKDVGARAPAVGGLALRLLVGLGGSSCEHVAALAAERGHKQRATAAERALAAPAPT